MKSFTDIEQSKRLVEILPIESSDMFFWCGDQIRLGSYMAMDNDFDIPAWSLAALLGIIREIIGYTLQTTYDKDPKVFIVCELGDKPYSIASLEYDNEVDACYEMILKLKENNLL